MGDLAAAAAPLHQRVRPLAGAAVTAAVVTGGAVQLGVLDTSRVRWVHHALFGAALVTCSIVVLSGGRPSVPLLLSWAALAALPLTRGGTVAHGATAAVAAVGYGADVLRSR